MEASISLKAEQTGVEEKRRELGLQLVEVAQSTSRSGGYNRLPTQDTHSDQALLETPGRRRDRNEVKVYVGAIEPDG